MSKKPSRVEVIRDYVDDNSLPLFLFYVPENNIKNNGINKEKVIIIKPNIVRTAILDKFNTRLLITYYVHRLKETKRYVRKEK